MCRVLQKKEKTVNVLRFSPCTDRPLPTKNTARGRVSTPGAGGLKAAAAGAKQTLC